MKPRIRIHAASIIFVTIVAIIAIVGTRGHSGSSGTTAASPEIGGLSFVDFSSPFQKALALDVMNVYFPGQFDKNAAIVAAAAGAQEKSLRDKLQTSASKTSLSWNWFLPIATMYAKFLLIYVIVMVLTYYGVQTMGVWRFSRQKSAVEPGRVSETPALRLVKKTLIGIGSFILFCPAYVIAYSLRTELNTDTVLFMIVLCVLSNGLLMVYANKFYAFLKTESRKGYVDTAIVKNLHNEYSRGKPGAFSWREICSPIKRFDGHVFGHIFRNARFQYLSTIKEQATFLITGMIITEMALNLHGYLTYEMLRQMLYGNWDIVIVMLLLIFYTVKGTDVFTDLLVARENKKYDND